MKFLSKLAGLFKSEAPEATSKLSLAAPWTIYYRQLQALFKNDPSIQVSYDADEPAVKLRVEEAEKAAALARLLPTEKAFGNVTVKIAVIPANGAEPSAETAKASRDFPLLFDGNASLAYTSGVLIGANQAVFVVFKPEIVQFYNDDVSDIHGLCTTYNADICKEIFAGVDGVFFCTEKADPALACPLLHSLTPEAAGATV